MTAGEWVGLIQFSPETEQKLRQKHNLTPAAVKEAVLAGAHTEARWDWSDDHGERLMLKGEGADGPMVVYLRPIDRIDGTWECVTAWRCP